MRTKTERIGPMKAIQYFCKECYGYQPEEVPNCPSKLCPLWPFRMGTEKNYSQGSSKSAKNTGNSEYYITSAENGVKIKLGTETFFQSNGLRDSENA